MLARDGETQLVIAPDEKTYAYLKGRRHAPRGALWDQALAHWKTLPSDPGARFEQFHKSDHRAAAFVTVSSVSSLIVRPICPGNTGAMFTSLTTTTKLFVALNAGTPLSVTTVVNVFVLGPCASVGVHVITPALLIPAFPGGFTKL